MCGRKQDQGYNQILFPAVRASLNPFSMKVPRWVCAISDLFFDRYRLHRAGFRSLLAGTLKLFGYFFHFCRRYIPLHLKNFRADFHACFIPDASFIVYPNPHFLYLPFLVLCPFFCPVWLYAKVSVDVLSQSRFNQVALKNKSGCRV